jgi:capsid protein
LLKEKKGGGWGPGASSGLPFAQKVTDEGGRKMEEHDWGMMWRGGPDDDLTGFETRNPQPTWAPYLEHHLRIIAPAFNIPFEYLRMDFSSGSYTAQRSASLHARHSFLREHQRVVNQFCKRDWNWSIAKAVKNGLLPAAPVDPRTGVSEWYWSKWTKPNYGYLNPGEDAKGKRELWNMGLDSLETMIDGEEDRDEVFQNKMNDIEKAHTLAKDFNKRNPDAPQLTWRDVITSLAPGQNPQPLPGENKGEDNENKEQ